MKIRDIKNYSDDRTRKLNVEKFFLKVNNYM